MPKYEVYQVIVISQHGSRIKFYMTTFLSNFLSDDSSIPEPKHVVQ